MQPARPGMRPLLIEKLNMKRFGTLFLFSLLAVGSFAQKGAQSKTLLWKVTGNGLVKPTYIFGTIHMLCKDDANLGPQLTKAIGEADKVYLELDMDNLFEMFGVMNKMKMRNDTTLSDLLSKEEYEKVKTYFEEHSSMLPFSVLETYKPMVASSMLMEQGFAGCGEKVAMEQLIMEEAKKNGKSINGLETMAFQMGIFDSIPYKVQAAGLLKAISGSDKSNEADKEFEAMLNAYKAQDLEKLGAIITASDDEMMQYQDLLLFNRNYNWVAKLQKLMPEQSLVVAVGAGHLPGEKGVLNLLRKAGYTVSPVENDMRKKLRVI